MDRPSIGSIVAPSSKAEIPVAEETPDATAEWFWERNVTDAVARYFGERGRRTISQADTRTKERGIDCHAVLGNEEIVVEVKGYPSRSYRDQRRSSERKPTSPTLQAQHRCSHALKAMRIHSAHPEAKTMVAFPDFPRCRTLFNETERAVKQLCVAVLFVSETGEVEAVGL